MTRINLKAVIARQVNVCVNLVGHQPAVQQTLTSVKIRQYVLIFTLHVSILQAAIYVSVLMEWSKTYLDSVKVKITDIKLLIGFN